MAWLKMKLLLALVSGMSLAVGGASDPPGARRALAAAVAVGPFSVERDSAGLLRAVADTCLERLVRGLSAQGLTVVRVPGLSEQTLQLARPALWAVLGHVVREGGQIQAELRLMDVESAEEQRSYFNADKDPDAVGNLGAAAAKRIAMAVRERKAAR